MPGHFTHIYTARRVADLLASGNFTDWPDLGGGGDAVAGYDPKTCGELMQKWEKFTAIGAIGPDLFFFFEDWNWDVLGPYSDDIMLALAVYYFFDAANDDDWEPVLKILDQVNSTLAGIIRLLIWLQKKWSDFVKVWDKTIGPLVDVVGEIADDLTGGILSEFGDAVQQLLNAIETVGVQEITTYAGLWSLMNTVVAKGYQENSFLWSDMTHYRRTSATCQALVHQAELLLDGSDGAQDRHDQFLAFTMGYITHVGTDTIAHSFVNEQCGGPYRDHPTRHHLIENHIDARNYEQTGPGGTIPQDPWGKTDAYPGASSSALQFAVALDLNHDNPHNSDAAQQYGWTQTREGWARPDPLPDDHDDQKAAVDIDGEMPDWMANAIVAALIETFADHPHPLICQGDAYQQQIDQGKLTSVVESVTGHGLDRPFQELLNDIAPPPPFAVPRGFPLPWEVATAYRLMITVYKLNFNGGWELPKPRQPDFVIVPPLSDFTNLFQPPDFSGVNSDNPIEDACDIFVALVQWIVKELAAAVKGIGDLIKMELSPWTFPVREGLYKLAMKLWDVATKTHEVMAHTGVFMPHTEQRYPDNGELMWPNEIDLPLVTLGATIDGTFKQALADALDPFGAVDRSQDVIVSHSVRDPNMPYYPVLQFHPDCHPSPDDPCLPDEWEYHRPWAYPVTSEWESGGHNTEGLTPTETYDPSKCHQQPGPPGAFKPMRPGPYPEGTTPDQVFFRTNAGFDAEARYQYENSQSPWQTDELNEQLIGQARRRVSPLGDPVPFSAYLIGRLVNDTDYQTQFNLDADRAYAYLTWDWIRRQDTPPKGKTSMNFSYQLPVVPPWKADYDKNNPSYKWDQITPMQLDYVDPPPPVIIETPAQRGRTKTVGKTKSRRARS
jgi:hypothetical protein